MTISLGLQGSQPRTSVRCAGQGACEGAVQGKGEPGRERGGGRVLVLERMQWAVEACKCGLRPNAQNPKYSPRGVWTLPPCMLQRHRIF